MAQQINLCTPILLTEKRYFSAATIVQALALFALVGGSLAAYWVWSLKSSTAGFKQAMSGNTTELARLRAAIEVRKAGGAPPEPQLVQQLQAGQTNLARKEALINDMRQGLFKEGWGQSARMQLVSQSIPAQVWITAMRADNAQLDLTGMTLEPAALRDWVLKLNASPLLQGQRLAALKIEQVKPDTAIDGRPKDPGPQVWSFNLVSALNPAVQSIGADKPTQPKDKP
jgi:hypothetical protein